MAVNTLLLDFSVQPDDLKNEQDMSATATKVENVLRDHVTGLKVVDSFPVEGGYFKLYTSDGGVISSIRVFSSGLVTLNIEYYRGEAQEPIFDYKVGGDEINKYLFVDGSFQLLKHLEQKFQLALNSFRTKLFPPLRRGAALDVYLTSSGSNFFSFFCIPLSFACCAL